jgi:hypothetical protein
VLETVAARVDPELALLPPLAAPRLAGSSLLMLTVALACATLGTSISAAALILSRLPRVGWHTSLLQIFPPQAPESLALVPPVALILGCAAAAVLLATSETIGKRQNWLLFGLSIWSIAAWFVPDSLHLALIGVIAMVTLVGLGPVVSQLGQRSRAYRHAAHAQQAIGPLTASIAIGVLTLLVAELSRDAISSETAHSLKLVATVCLAMANVGFVYLVVNAVWIWRSLWGWQPLLERVLVTEPAE